MNDLSCMKLQLGFRGTFDLLSRDLQVDGPGAGPLLKRVVLLSVE